MKGEKKKDILVCLQGSGDWEMLDCKSMGCSEFLYYYLGLHYHYYLLFHRENYVGCRVETVELDEDYCN